MDSVTTLEDYGGETERVFACEMYLWHGVLLYLWKVRVWWGELSEAMMHSKPPIGLV
jgi:hypothetical protein